MINEWKVTLSVNAGLSLRTRDLCIWVDALHNEKTLEFSALSPEHQRFLFESPEFAHPDVIFFTHTHPDHYSEKLCSVARIIFPDAILVLPSDEHKGQIVLNEKEVIIKVKECMITFRKTVHEGEVFKDEPHYAMLAEDNGESILVLGDSSLAGDDLKEWLTDKAVDSVFVPFPWILLEKGRRFLKEVIRPESVIIYHLPLVQDDIYGYIEASRKAAEQIDEDGSMSVRLLTEAFQTIVL